MKDQSLLEGNESEVKRHFKQVLKRYVTDFYFWWHNAKGTNTRQGYEEWEKDNDLTIDILIREASPPPSSILPEGDGAEFLKYVSEAREGFSAFILSLPFDNALRTKVDDILIAFDQMAERLKK